MTEVIHEVISRGEIRRTLPDGRQISTTDRLSTLANADSWISDGWQPSLRYFLESEGFTAERGELEVLRDPGTDRVAQPEVDSLSTVEPPRNMPVGCPSTVAQLLLGRRSLRKYSQDFRTSKSQFDAVAGDVLAMVDSRIARGASGLRYRVINYRMGELEPGVYGLGTDGKISAHSTGDHSEGMVDIMCGMEAARSADATVVISFVARERQELFPYERALRELYIDAGRIAQWWILRLEQDGRGSLITPATNDRAIAELLEMEQGEYPLYTITFGGKERSLARQVGTTQS